MVKLPALIPNLINRLIEFFLSFLHFHVLDSPIYLCKSFLFML